MVYRVGTLTGCSEVAGPREGMQYCCTLQEPERKDTGGVPKHVQKEPWPNISCTAPDLVHRCAVNFAM